MELCVTMPSVPSISFNVRYNLTGAPSLLLTDTTTYPVGAIGIFTVTQPDGYVRTGNFATPDITSSGGTFSTDLRLSSTGGVQCGTYIIKYEIKTTDDVISTFTRNFVFQYEPVELVMVENFDVFTPSLSYSDGTNYSVSGYNNTSPTRLWTGVSIPTGTKTSTTAAISLQHNGNYYDAVYTITLASTLLYSHQTYAWLSVQETISKTVTAEACTPEPIEDLIPLIETLRQQSIECNGDFPDFEKAQTLFSHLTDMLKVLLLGGVTQEGIYDVYEDLLVILHNNQSIPCVHTNLPIPAYDLGSYAVSQFPIDAAYCTLIGDGFNTVYNVTHNLNDDCVLVQVYEVSSGAQVITDVTILSNNSVSVSFATAPSTNAYKVIVHSGNGGMVGATGPQGPAGAGLVPGGTTGQFLRKSSSTNYDAAWDTLTLEDSTDVLFQSKSDNDGVFYDLATGLWKNKSKSSWLGGTASQFIKGDGTLDSNTYLTTSAASAAYVPQSRTISINGTSYDLSADRSWTISSGNIYNTDGTLTGNRVVTLNSNQLVYRDSSSTLQNYTYSVGVPTGVSAGTWPSSVIYEAQYLISASSAEPFNTRLWGRNQSASIKQLWVNQVYADITGESTGAPYIYNQTFNTRRGSQLDTSTANGWMEGLRNIIGHAYTGSQSTTTQINTSNLVAYRNSVLNYVGNISNAFGVLNELFQSTTTTTQNSTITNYYGYYTAATVGTSSGPTATITNYYGLYFNTPTVGTTGVITNRWGIYAPDSAMRHHLNGNVIIGGSTDAGYKLDVQGTGRFTNNIYLGLGKTIGTDEGVGTRPYIYFGTTGVFYNNWTFEPNANGGVVVASAYQTISSTSAIFEIASTTRGFLPPRMTTTQRNAISTPAIGLVVYQTDATEGLYQYKSTGWALISGGSGTVTSVALSTGTTGTDINISGSPITTSGTITINIPDASASARGVVTTGSQTFAGDKTFNGTTTLGGLLTYLGGSQQSYASNSGSQINNQTITGVASVLVLHKNFYNISGTTLNANAAGIVFYEYNRGTAYTTSTSGTHPLVAYRFMKGLVVNANATTPASITNYATLYIEDAATGTATITNNYAIWVDNGAVRFDGNVELQGISSATGANMLYYDTTTKRVTYGAAPSGSGSVSSVSVVSANGFAGTVATATTTPAITISTTVTGLLKGNGTAISAAVAGTDYLVSNQTITLSGDISGSGSTAITTAIGANKVTNAMLSQVSTATFKGRVTAATGNVEDLTGTQATTLLDTFTSALKGLAPASGGGTTNFLRADGTWAAPSGTGFANPMTLLGDMIYGGASGAATRLAGNTTTTKQFLSQTGNGTISAAPSWATIAGSDITGAALTKTDDTNVTLTLGGTPATALLRAASITVGWTGTLAVSRGGTGAGTLTGILVGNGTSAVTAITGTANQLIRRNAGDTAYEFFTPTYLTANQSITLSGAVTGTGTTAITTTLSNSVVGIANLSATGTPSATTYLRGDNTWATISGGVTDGDKGDITVSGGGATWTIDNTVVTYSKIQNVSANSFLANDTGTAASVQEIATNRIPLFASAITGTPSSTTFLRGDGAWATPAGGSGITSLNTLTGATQAFATGTTGTDFGISSTGTTHTFNIPDASATARGLVTTGSQTIAGAKTFSSTPIITASTGLNFTSGGFTGTIRFAGVESVGTRAFDIVYPTNGGFRFGVSGVDGPLFQAWGGTDPSFAGQMYFDYGSYARTISGRAAYIRNQTLNSVATVMSFFASSNVAVGTTTDSGFKFDVNGSSRLNGAATLTNTVTMSGIASTTTANVLYFNSSTGAVTYGAAPSGSPYSVTNKTATYTETATSGTVIVKCDTTTGAFTINLPTAVGNTATIIVKKIAGTGAVTIDGNASETIDGGATAIINKVYESITLISDNLNWQIV